jgi:farnesyl diphosphate synthase
MTAFESRLATFQATFEPLLAAEFPLASDNRVEQAARYSVVAGGKRLRPFLVRAAARACGVQDDRWLSPALAVEMIHTYSLIHDDLPAMDDDDLRRGHLTCHKAFSEALAILAGDGLQMQAIETLLSAPDADLNAHQKLKMTRCLSAASGFKGMVGGQALDIGAEGQSVSLESLRHIHALKTGALITAAIEMGCLCQPTISDAQLAVARQFGGLIGLAFQVVDDILDVNGDTAVLGKAQGADVQHHKATYPALLGLEGAKQYATELYEQAIGLLDGWQSDTRELHDLASFVLMRNR